MKKLIATCIGIALLAMSCVQNEGDIQDESFSLTSPNGILLAQSVVQLKELIVLNSAIDRVEDLTIEEVGYVENESGTFAIVNFLKNEKKGSMLVSLAVNEGYHFMVDKKNVYIKKMPSSIQIQNLDDPSRSYSLEVGASNILEDDPMGKQAWVTSSAGDLWSIVKPGHFSCVKNTDGQSTKSLIFSEKYSTH